MKTMNKLVAFMAMAMLSVTALADKEPRQEFYISPEIGHFTAKGYCKDIRSVLGTETPCLESEIGFGLIGGYQFNDFIAAEAGIRIANGFDVSTANFKFDLDYKSYSLGGVVRSPIGDRVAITSKAGYHSWDLDANVSGSGSSISVSTDGTGFYSGVGLESSTTDNISFRAEYTKYELEEESFDVISGKLLYSF